MYTYVCSDEFSDACMRPPFFLFLVRGSASLGYVGFFFQASDVMKERGGKIALEGGKDLGSSRRRGRSSVLAEKGWRLYRVLSGSDEK